MIFIDELDRCRPDYTVQLLEHIKHYMFYDRITFVFSVNIDQLQHTIKQYYGIEFEASSYLDRFFDLHVSLPTPSYEQKRKAVPWGADSSSWVKWCRLIASEFKFELREENHFYELIKQSLDCQDDSIIPIHQNTEDERKFTISFLKAYFVPLGLALRIKNINDFYSFIEGNNKKALNIFNKYFNSLSLDIFCEQLGVSSSLSQEFKSKKNNDILEQLYDAVFNTIYDYSNKITTVGQLQINALIQNEFFGLLTSLHK